MLLLLWQGCILVLAPPRYMLPAPLDVFAVLWKRQWDLLLQAKVTLIEIVLSLFCGTLAGILVAILVVSCRPARRIIWPLVLVLQSLPVFALAPLLVLWFGFGMASKVVMASLIIFFPVASAFADGLRRTELEIVEVGQLLGAGRWSLLWRLRIPLAMPGLVSGLRIAAPLAPLGAVVGEWVGASAGLGFVMLQANARMQTETLFAALFLLAVLTLLLRFLVDSLARYLVPWARQA